MRFVWVRKRPNTQRKKHRLIGDKTNTTKMFPFCFSCNVITWIANYVYDSDLAVLQTLMMCDIYQGSVGPDVGHKKK